MSEEFTDPLSAASMAALVSADAGGEEGGAEADDATPEEDGAEVAPSETDSEAVEPAEAAEAAEESTDQAPEAEPEPEAPAIDAPSQWSSEAKEGWAKIPAHAQTYIAQRESEAHAKISELGQKAALADKMEELKESYQDVWDKSLTSDELTQRYLNFSREMATQPLQFIAKLADAYKVDLSIFGAEQDAQQVLAGVQAQNEQLRQQLHQMKTAEQTRERKATQQRETEEARQRDEAQKEAEAFIAKHKVTDNVTSKMAGLLSSGIATTLSEAHELALRLLGEPGPQTPAPAPEERKEAAVKAQRKGTIRPKSAPAQTRKFDDPLGVDAMKAAFYGSSSA